MEAPGITRHRRPFLAPLWVTALAVLVVVVVAAIAYRSATTTVVVLVPVGEREPGAIEDPPITDEGEQRAQRLAQMFGRVSGLGRVSAIYVGKERRAQQQAAPLADLLHLSATAFESRDAAATAAGLLRAHDGSAVLVVADPAASQQFLRELTGSGVAAPAAEEGSLLYIVSVPTLGRAQVLQIRY